jgi:two-component system response regulator MtrA
MALDKRLVLFGPALPGTPHLDELLRARGLQVYVVEAEEEVLDALTYSGPDAVLLLGPQVPALPRLLAARQDSPSLLVVVWPSIPAVEAVTLLEHGVDYVASTAHPDWLAAQIRAYLRRSGRDRLATTVITLPELRIDLAERRVTVRDEVISLTPTEFSVLRVLAERPGTVLPSGEIMQHVMGVRIPEPEAQDLLKVHIHRLRQKLEGDPENPRFIRTVRGHGYMYAFERRSQGGISAPPADDVP